MEGTFQSNITSLPKLGHNRYENIFKLYKSNDGKHFYNLKKSVIFPDDINDELIDKFVLDRTVPWTIISYNIYSTIFLWWTITELNKIANPVILPPAGTVLKYIKPKYIDEVLAKIQLQING